MARVITFSTKFPAKHPRAGESTNFVEQIWNGLRELNLPVPKNSDFTNEFMWSILPSSNFDTKVHTIRSGDRWKVGDKFSPRIWSGKPYASKQIILSPDVTIKKVWGVKISADVISGEKNLYMSIIDNGGKHYHPSHVEKMIVAERDGLKYRDFVDWFLIHPKKLPSFSGQIICWDESVEYTPP